MSREAAPPEVFDDGLQHERTALAWERTAIAVIVAGTLLGRYGASAGHSLLGFTGGIEVLFGGGLLVWSGFHYNELHGPLRRGEAVVHPRATMLVGAVSVFFCGAAALLAFLVAVIDP